MVKAIVLLENLKNGVSFANHGISSRGSLPSLLNFLIEAKDGNLYISSTDLEIGIRVKIPAKIEEEGEITIPAKTFMDLVSNLNVEKVELIEKSSTLELKGEKVKTSFPTLPAGEFPKLYEEKGEKRAELVREKLSKGMSRVVFSAATDTGRPALSGVLIKKEQGGEELTMVATDGYRLSLEKNANAGGFSGGEVSLLIPARIIKELLSIKDNEQPIELYTFQAGNQVLFECGDITVVGRLIEAEYPNYQKIIPEEFSTQAQFNREDAQNAVRVSSIFAREAANIIKMSVGKEGVKFSANTASVGENEVEVEAKVEGEENEIAFNARYLLDLFGNTEEETIIFQMTGPLNPGVFRLGLDSSYLHLIMPIRVQG